MATTITVVTGPTASGKTGRSLALAAQSGAAIISADSRMVYQGLDIGTGKPTWEYRVLPSSPWIKPKPDPKNGPVYRIRGIDHYLLDVVPAETPFSLTDWLERTRRLISQFQIQQQPVVIVGGTGLYLKALLAGYQPPPTDPTVRATIEKLETTEIYQKLHAVDPVTARREKDNRRRLIRALEIYQLTSQPASAVSQNTPLPAEVIRLTLPRAELFARIDERIQNRLEAGMVEEVEGLLNKGIAVDWLMSIGLEYRTITEWLNEGKQDRDELVARLQQVIHAYARRQETYLRTQLVTSPLN